MVTQIFGTKKCKDTQKAIRFFKERRWQFQFIDLKEKDISQGELNSIKRFFDIEDIIDSDGKEYEKRNLKYMKFNIEDTLLENPLLFKTPIVRSAKQITIGYQPEIWKKWQ
ncbi:MAG: ArsC family transcriptional regulator [Candidatus Zixiibacteriota bacterium]|nr:MAG: ArsC family transcriptional regulator [candidate division Zixibacteria bacterium]